MRDSFFPREYLGIVREPLTILQIAGTVRQDNLSAVNAIRSWARSTEGGLGKWIATVRTKFFLGTLAI